MKRTLVSSTDTHFRGTEPGKADDNAVDGACDGLRSLKESSEATPSLATEALSRDPGLVMV